MSFYWIKAKKVDILIFNDFRRKILKISPPKEHSQKNNKFPTNFSVKKRIKNHLLKTAPAKLLKMIKNLFPIIKPGRTHWIKKASHQKTPLFRAFSQTSTKPKMIANKFRDLLFVNSAFKELRIEQNKRNHVHQVISLQNLGISDFWQKLTFLSRLGTITTPRLLLRSWPTLLSLEFRRTLLSFWIWRQAHSRIRSTIWSGIRFQELLR